MIFLTFEFHIKKYSDRIFKSIGLILSSFAKSTVLILSFMYYRSFMIWVTKFSLGDKKGMGLHI